MTTMNANLYQTIDYNLLESFISHAKAVSGQGRTGPDKILALDGPFLTTLLQDCNDASSIIAALNRLKALTSALDLLSQAVKEGFPRVRAGVLPAIYQRGILSLPIEVISQIFEEVCNDDDVRMHACEGLALVSKDFRDIALNTPQLWTRMTGGKYPKHYLERSRSTGIDISIRNTKDFTPDRARLFLQMVVPHSSRWKSFSLDIVLKDSLRDLFSDLHNISPENDFLSLTTLRIGYFDLDNDLGIDQDPDKDLKHFFNTWKLPALRTVETYNFVPSMPSTTSITCLRLNISGEDSGELFKWSLGEVAESVRQLHSLNELSINLTRVENPPDLYDVDVELPQLKKLRIGMDLRENGMYFYELLRAISTPNLSKLTLHVEAYMISVLESRLWALFREGSLSRWSHLESLDFEVRLYDETYMYNMSDRPLSIVFTRLPRLQHLRISCTGINSPSTLTVHKRERGQSPYPPLRTLQLEECFMFDTSFIFSIKDIINAPVFETLEITDCPRIDEEIVQKMMPKGKALKWKLDAYYINKRKWGFECFESRKNTGYSHYVS